jgi:hypothetical protein
MAECGRVSSVEEDRMEEQPTCGQGLATHALLPQLIAELMNATAENLITHLPMLVAGDADTQHERSVYEHLSTRHREAAAMLDGIATEMKEQQDMRMGQHDVDAMSHEGVTKALESMVRAEAQLVAQLELQLVDHRAMVDEMGS